MGACMFVCVRATEVIKIHMVGGTTGKGPVLLSYADRCDFIKVIVRVYVLEGRSNV